MTGQPIPPNMNASGANLSASNPANMPPVNCYVPPSPGGRCKEEDGVYSFRIDYCGLYLDNPGLCSSS